MMTRQLPSLTRKSMARGHLGEATLLAAALLASACGGTLNQEGTEQTKSVGQAVAPAQDQTKLAEQAVAPAGGKDQTESVEQAVVTDADRYLAVFGDSSPDHHLTIVGDSSGVTTLAAHLAPGTNPAIATTGSQYQIAFNDRSTGTLWYYSGLSKQFYPTYCGIDPTSSPAITSLPSTNFVIAFQDGAHILHLYDSYVLKSTGGLGVYPGTSPAIASFPNGGYLVAFHAYPESGKPSGYLWLYDSRNGGKYNTGLLMAPNTSPSIAVSLNDTWQVAFQDYYTSRLWTYDGATWPVDTNIGMMPKTSPSIAAVPSGGYQIAVHDSIYNGLYLLGPLQQGETWYGPAPDSSPSIAVHSDGTFEAGIAGGGTNHFWFYGKNQGPVTKEMSVSLGAGSSPSVVARTYPFKLTAVEDYTSGTPSAKLTWNNVGATQYTLSRTCSPGGSSSPSYPAGTTSATVTESLGNSCNYMIKACFANGACAWTQNTQLNFKPPAPTKLRVSWSAQSSSVTANVSWDAVQAANLRYYAGKSCGGSAFTWDYNVTTTSKSWTGLKFSTACTFAVAAFAAGGQSTVATITASSPAQNIPPPTTGTISVTFEIQANNTGLACGSAYVSLDPTATGPFISVNSSGVSTTPSPNGQYTPPGYGWCVYKTYYTVQIGSTHKVCGYLSAPPNSPICVDVTMPSTGYADARIN